MHFPNDNYNKLVFNRFLLCVLSLIILTFVSLPSPAQAHAYSASYTQITMGEDTTEMVFSMDVLSILELIPNIDENKNFILEKAEIKKQTHHIEELISEGLTFDVDNKEQTADIKKMKLVKKENKEFLSFYISFPDVHPGETISFNDGFYYNDSTANYINLVSSSFMGETSEAILQGNERTWTILLTEPQLEQGQQPDMNQVQPETAAPTEKASNSSWFSFFKLGMFHILTGYDHLLFLFALILRKQSFKQYAAIVTAFTIAHSITLSLAVLGWVSLPSRFVEATIAFSICYVAAENIFRKEIRHRWGITFLFGLIHGLGFATILKEMAIPKSHLAVALINFNLGIEVIQLSIVLLLLPVLAMMYKLKNSRKIVTYGSYAIVALGAIWLVQRIFQ